MKSNESDYLELARCVYIDACARCAADVSERDLDTLRTRVEHEGMSFLTITLPTFAKDFERSLADGGIDPTLFRSFKKSGAIPAFLQGMLGQLFDRDTGRLHERNRLADNVSASVVDSVRQVCTLFKKLALDCAPHRERAAVNSFVQTEHDLRVYLLEVSGDLRADFQLVSRYLWDNLVVSLRHDEKPARHGPGATAEGVSGNQKFRWKFWHDRLEPYFPLVSSAYPNSAIGTEEVEKVTMLASGQELPARVTTVPKTLKAPRIIAIEPCCMQYAQQAIRDVLYTALESYSMTAGHINFRDQTVNQALALSSSSDGRLATIDLSEASDRVPHELAMYMFDANPDLRDAIDACRSRSAALPDGEILSPLLKFASMGSALCFPVESMYFYTACVVTLLREQNLPATFANVYRVTRDVYVYGDDILVPAEHAEAVLEGLQKYNCKVNISKTFTRGNFRESCGMDAFRGERVTPVYLRKVRPLNRQQAAELVSWVETANLFYKKGYWVTCSYMRNAVERVLGVLPYVAEDSGALGWHSFLGYRTVERWNRKYQRLEVRAWVPEPVHRTDELDGYAALQKSLSKLESLPDIWAERDPLHLERSARHGAVTLKRRWVAVY